MLISLLAMMGFGLRLGIPSPSLTVGGAVAYSPSLDFSGARNSQYALMGLFW